MILAFLGAPEVCPGASSSAGVTVLVALLIGPLYYCSMTVAWWWYSTAAQSLVTWHPTRGPRASGLHWD